MEVCVAIPDLPRSRCSADLQAAGTWREGLVSHSDLPLSERILFLLEKVKTLPGCSFILNFSIGLGPALSFIPTLFSPLGMFSLGPNAGLVWGPRPLLRPPAPWRLTPSRPPLRMRTGPPGQPVPSLSPG